MILTHGANSLLRGNNDPDVIGGRKYRTVTIGNQTWLAENLDFKFSGLEINSYEFDFPIPAAWYYNRDEATYGIDGTYKCGLLYNWYAVKYLEDNKSALIPGWHVPTDAEWNTLKTVAGNNPGTKLKAFDNSVASGFPNGWNGTDDYGFGVLPAGRYTGRFNSFDTYAYFATSSEYDNDYYFFKFFDFRSSVDGNYNPKYYAYPVRLVKDT